MYDSTLFVQKYCVEMTNIITSSKIQKYSLNKIISLLPLQPQIKHIVLKCGKTLSSTLIDTKCFTIIANMLVHERKKRFA